MQYIQNEDIGYNRNALIVIREAGYLGDKLATYRDELRKDPQIKNITTSAYVPAGPTDNNMTSVQKVDDPVQRLRIRVYDVDEEYIPTLGMKLLNGRNFATNQDQQTNNAIINKSAIKACGFPANPVDQTLTRNGETQELLTIVGVVKNFHLRPLREPIEPLIMEYKPYYGLILKAENHDIPGLWNPSGIKWVRVRHSNMPFSMNFSMKLTSKKVI